MEKTFVLVTGANGFVGRALCQELYKSGFRVRAAVRRVEEKISGVDEFHKIEDIASDIDWNKALYNVDTVIHLISRTHIIKDKAYDPLSEFRRINVTGTEKLAIAAAKCGVRRFIYLSSVKVNGECTGQLPFNEENVPQPQDHYGATKLEAERVLNRIREETGLEVVILRPPLVYGPGVKANFLFLLKLVKYGIPLPLARINNNRSIIYVGNLADVIIKCVKHPKAANQTFLVSDGKNISTPDLIREIAKAFRRKTLLLPFSVRLLRILGKISGKSSEAEKILNSLCVDISKIVNIMGWKPPYTTEQGIKSTVDSYIEK